MLVFVLRDIVSCSQPLVRMFFWFFSISFIFHVPFYNLYSFLSHDYIVLCLALSNMMNLVYFYVLSTEGSNLWFNLCRSRQTGGKSTLKLSSFSGLFVPTVPVIGAWPERTFRHSVLI